jgi:hypothetical protein
VGVLEARRPPAPGELDVVVGPPRPGEGALQANQVLVRLAPRRGAERAAPARAVDGNDALSHVSVFLPL